MCDTIRVVLLSGRDTGTMSTSSVGGRREREIDDGSDDKEKMEQPFSVMGVSVGCSFFSEKRSSPLFLIVLKFFLCML